MNKIWLATRNPGKLREMRSLLGGLPLALMDVIERPDAPEVEETGADYAANAALKARAIAAFARGWALADDTGLEVDVLDGAPGLHSSRYAGPGASDRDRRSKLLAQLQSFPRPWRARFVCHVALSSPTGEMVWTEGECPGEIIPEERGDGGFGYDAVFLVDGCGRTMAELDLEAKNQISHRAIAVMKMHPIIIEKLSLEPGPG